jgi:hypothetical protein
MNTLAGTHVPVGCAECGFPRCQRGEWNRCGDVQRDVFRHVCRDRSGQRHKFGIGSASSNQLCPEDAITNSETRNLRTDFADNTGKIHPGRKWHRKVGHAAAVSRAEFPVRRIDAGGSQFNENFVRRGAWALDNIVPETFRASEFVIPHRTHSTLRSDDSA